MSSLDVLGNGIYELPEAARLIRAKPNRLRAWVRPSGSLRTAVFELDYQKVKDRYELSFLDLVEAFIASQMRERGVSFQRIRKAHRILEQRYETRHPFARQEMATDGRSVFVLFRENDRNHVEDVVEEQYEIPEVISQFLDRIEYNPSSHLAERWRPTARVVIDPTCRFGAPIVESVGIETSVLFAAYKANRGDPSLVASWYGVDPDDVEAAVRFETDLKAAA
jgi:uncharacterized protein (DUF433 family)